MTAFELIPTFSRIRVLLGDDVVADTRAARIALAEGSAPCFLVPRMDLQAELVPTDELAEDGGVLHEVRVREGRALSDKALVYKEHADLVRIDPRDLRKLRGRWDESPELTWLEEDRPGMPFARNPRHRVDVLPLSESTRIEIGDTVIAKSDAASLLLESGLPPRVYVPESDWIEGSLHPVEGGRTACPYKGIANYFDIRVGNETLAREAWGYDVASAPQNWLLPAIDHQRAVVASGKVQVYVGKTRLPLP